MTAVCFLVETEGR